MKYKKLFLLLLSVPLMFSCTNGNTSQSGEDTPSSDKQEQSSSKIEEPSSQISSQEISSSSVELSSSIDESPSDEPSSIEDSSTIEDSTFEESSIEYPEQQDLVHVPYEKVINITVDNFDKLPFIELSNVTPNTSYPNEFNINKSTGAVSSSYITGINKIEVSAYGSTENQTLLVDDRPVTSTRVNSKVYNGSMWTYELNGADNFVVSNTTTKTVYAFEIAIYYTGEITGNFACYEGKNRLELDSYSYSKHSKVEYSGVTDKDGILHFAPDGYIKAKDLDHLLSIETIQNNDLLSFYGIDESGVKTPLSLEEAIAENTKYTDLLIVNETTIELQAQAYVLTFEEDPPFIPSENLTIAQALQIGAGLSRNRGMTTEYYTITGTPTVFSGSQITFTDGKDNIILYSTNTPDNVYPKYELTLKGQIQNYYGTIEFVNYTVESFVQAKYNLTLNESTHGSYTVSKTSDLEYGEKITITLSPDEGYETKNVVVCGASIKPKGSEVTATVTCDSTVSVNFTEIKDGPAVITGDTFTIHSLEMHGTYGDANLVTYGNFDILFDGGTQDDGPYLNALLKEYVTDGVLDMIIISHPDSDHYAGIVSGNALVGLDDVKTLITNNGHSENDKIEAHVKSMFSDVELLKASNLTSVDNKVYTFDIDDYFSIDIMYSTGFEGSGKNNASIPVIINYKNTKVFMGGDMEQAACNSFITTYPELFDEDDFVIFKILHHGSKGSNYENFIEYLKPDLCFVNAPLKTLSPNNTPSFNTHPYLDCLERFGNYTTNLYWAGINGNLNITCDGYDAIAEGTIRTRDYYYLDTATNSYVKADREAEVNTPYFQSKWYLDAILEQGKPDFDDIVED